MHFGASMFFTDCSMTSVELAVALEQRGFEIIWAPEHSHIPLSRETPFIMGGDLPKRYYDVMDPFVMLTAAAMATENGRDPASLDISIGGQQPDVDLIKRYQDIGVNRVSCSLESAKADVMPPILDQWAGIIRQVNG